MIIFQCSLLDVQMTSYIYEVAKCIHRHWNGNVILTTFFNNRCSESCQLEWQLLAQPVYERVVKMTHFNYSDIIISAMTSQITGTSIVCLGEHQRKHQSSASLAPVRGIRQRPVDSPHKGPVTWKMCPFDDVIMTVYAFIIISLLKKVLQCVSDKVTILHVPLQLGCHGMCKIVIWLTHEK